MLRWLELLDRSLRRRRTRWEAKALGRLLAKTRDYSYTADYLTGNLPEWTRLFAPLAGRPGVRILEIGSYEGRSAVWLLEHVLTQADSELTCVDIFSQPRWELRFDHNVGLTGASHKIRKLKGRSADLLPTLPGASYDAIYVDGGHDAATVLLDAVLSWRLLKPGGLLLFDDYLWDIDPRPADRPKMAIDLFLDGFSGQYELIHKSYQVAVHKKL